MTYSSLVANLPNKQNDLQHIHAYMFEVRVIDEMEK